MPIVSVIIPAYGHAEYILQTLDSVFAQTFSDYEIIVVNDGSPDNTAEVLAPLSNAGKIRYFEQANQGVAAARNFGISHAKGDFIALLDDDDLWPPDKLQWQVAALQQDPSLSMVSGTWEAMDSDGVLNEARECATNVSRIISLEECFCVNPYISPGQILMRKQAILAVGSFDPSIWGCDDWDLWIRIASKGKIQDHVRVSLCYRLHASNASNNISKMRINGQSVITKNLHLITESDRVRLFEHASCWIYSWTGKRGLQSLPSAIRHFQIRDIFQNITALWPFLILSFTNRELQSRLLMDVWFCLKRTIKP